MGKNGEPRIGFGPQGHIQKRNGSFVDICTEKTVANSRLLAGGTVLLYEPEYGLTLPRQANDLHL